MLRSEYSSTGISISFLRHNGGGESFIVSWFSHVSEKSRRRFLSISFPHRKQFSGSVQARKHADNARSIPSSRRLIVRTGRSSISLPMRQHLIEQWIGAFFGEDIISSQFITLPHKFVGNCAHSKLEYWNCTNSFITLSARFPSAYSVTRSKSLSTVNGFSLN